MKVLTCMENSPIQQEDYQKFFFLFYSFFSAGGLQQREVNLEEIFWASDNCNIKFIVPRTYNKAYIQSWIRIYRVIEEDLSSLCDNGLDGVCKQFLL